MGYLWQSVGLGCEIQENIMVIKMEELKFRAAIKIDKKFTLFPFTLKDLIIPNPLFSQREFVIPWLLEGNKPDVFIGRKDKNDVEIYENDLFQVIDKNGHKGIYLVIFKEQEFLGKKLATDKDYFRWFGSAGEYFKDCEIIGNVYKNPELLKLKNGDYDAKDKSD